MEDFRKAHCKWLSFKPDTDTSIHVFVTICPTDFKPAQGAAGGRYRYKYENEILVRYDFDNGYQAKTFAPS
jgi:hypothetical protein